MSLDRKDLVYLAVSIVVPLLIYSSLFGGFFQQDEWLGYARSILLKGSTLAELIAYLFSPGVGHFAPLTPLLVYLSFLVFGLNYDAHVWIALIMHTCAIFLFYCFAKFFFQKNLAFLATLLFGLAASSFQGTAWVVANIGTHMSSIFGLLSLIFITRFLDLHKLKFFVLSISSLIISLLFKELTVGLFVILPLLIVLWGNFFKQAEKTRYASIILFVGIIYLAFRAFLLINLSEQLVEEYSPRTSRIAYNFVAVPVKSISQALIPVDTLKELSFKLALLVEPEYRGDYGSPEFEIFAVKRVLEIVSVVFSLGFIILAIKVIKSKEYKKVALYSILFMLLNSAIIAFAPEKGGIISIIDSRNLYFVSIGSSLLAASILASFSKKFLIFISLAVLSANVYFLNQSLAEFNNRGKIRYDILQEIKNAYPVLPPKVIFYTESDTSFYGLPKDERVLPFQSGFGQTLLSWYYPTQNFPKEFFEYRFLWEINSQGYKEFEGIAFGYFRDFEELAKFLPKNKLDKISILSFRYDSSRERIYDISEEIRGRLIGFQASKNQLFQSHFTLTSADNPQDILLATDNNRETNWHTSNPYEISQSVDIKLDNIYKIAEIDIDTYNNKDQNEVGFKVYVSNDNQDWLQVFYSKKYPPDKEGMIKIYLPPSTSHFLKIEQVGEHKYAPWVIHELKLYESLEK